MVASKRITQANSLAMSQESLSLGGLRLIYSVVANLRMDQEHFETVEIPLAEMQEILQVSQKSVYREAKRAALELLNQTILLGDDNNGWVAFQWASESRYIPAKNHPRKYSAIKIRLHENLKPFLLQLKSHFNSFPQQVLYEVNSQYVFKLFQILWFESHSGKRTVLEFEVEEFKKRLNLESKYAEFSAFRRQLDTLITQLNETKLGLKVQVEKVGRPVVMLRFHIHSEIEVQETLPDAERALILEMKRLGFHNPHDAIKSYGRPHVERSLAKTRQIMHEAKSGVQIENPAALLHHLLKKDYEEEIFEIPEDDTQEKVIQLVDEISTAFDLALRLRSQEVWELLNAEEKVLLQEEILTKANQVVAGQIEKLGWTSRIAQTSILRCLELNRAEVFGSELSSIRQFACGRGFNETPHFEQAIVILEQTYS